MPSQAVAARSLLPRRLAPVAPREPSGALPTVAQTYEEARFDKKEALCVLCRLNLRLPSGGVPNPPRCARPPGSTPPGAAASGHRPSPAWRGAGHAAGRGACVTPPQLSAGGPAAFVVPVATRSRWRSARPGARESVTLLGWVGLSVPHAFPPRSSSEKLVVVLAPPPARVAHKA